MFSSLCLSFTFYFFLSLVCLSQRSGVTSDFPCFKNNLPEFCVLRRKRERVSKSVRGKEKGTEGERTAVLSLCFVGICVSEMLMYIQLAVCAYVCVGKKGMWEGERGRKGEGKGLLC